MSAKIPDKKKREACAHLLSALRGQIKLHQALGIDEYPATPDLARFMELTARQPGTPAGVMTSAQQGPTLSMPEGSGGKDEATLVFLRQEMMSCRLCRLHEARLGTVVGSGNLTCDLMVVGDWSQQKKTGYSQEVLFGPEEDVMFWKMMAAIKLAPEAVYVTNSLKCCPGEGVLPDRTCETCFSFLEREIALVRPRVICAMGEVAARLLTGSAEPLARLRGKFARYRYQSGHDIAVIPTYHPRFLLQNKEMKRAAWLDLQAVEKLLHSI